MVCSYLMPSFIRYAVYPGQLVFRAAVTPEFPRKFRACLSLFAFLGLVNRRQAEKVSGVFAKNAKTFWPWHDCKFLQSSMASLTLVPDSPTLD